MANQRSPGSISIITSQGGLTPGVEYEFRFMLRSSPFRTQAQRTYTGNLTVRYT